MEMEDLVTVTGSLHVVGEVALEEEDVVALEEEDLIRVMMEVAMNGILVGTSLLVDLEVAEVDLVPKGEDLGPNRVEDLEMILVVETMNGGLENPNLQEDLVRAEVDLAQEVVDLEEDLDENLMVMRLQGVVDLEEEEMIAGKVVAVTNVVMMGIWQESVQRVKAVVVELEVEVVVDAINVVKMATSHGNAHKRDNPGVVVVEEGDVINVEKKGTLPVNVQTVNPVVVAVEVLATNVMRVDILLGSVPMQKMVARVKKRSERYMFHPLLQKMRKKYLKLCKKG